MSFQHTSDINLIGVCEDAVHGTYVTALSELVDRFRSRALVYNTREQDGSRDYDIYLGKIFICTSSSDGDNNFTVIETSDIYTEFMAWYKKMYFSPMNEDPGSIMQFINEWLLS